MYWLKTFNNLPHSKSFHCTMEEVLETIKDSIKAGEVNERALRKEKIECDFAKKTITSLEKADQIKEVGSWKGFTMSDLISDPNDKSLSHICSIVVCSCSDDCKGKFLIGDE